MTDGSRILPHVPRPDDPPLQIIVEQPHSPTRPVIVYTIEPPPKEPGQIVPFAPKDQLR